MEFNAVAEGFKFMLLGMGTVFVFLILMIVVIMIQHRIFEKFFPDKLPEPPKKRPVVGDNKAKKVAAIAAAIKFHSSK